MEEVAGTGQVHGHAGSLSGLDNFLITDRTARVHNGTHAGVQQHLFWFYPQQPFEEMCETLSAMLKEIPVTCDSVPA